MASDAHFLNKLLSTLPTPEIDRIRDQLTLVPLVVGKVIYEAESCITEVFFPESGIVSLTADTVDQGQVEVGMTGAEGLVGVSVVLNPDPRSVHRTFTQSSGQAYRLSAADFRTATTQPSVLRDRCLRYAEVLLVQSSQVAACNARHDLSQRLARWLLLARDLVGDKVRMTHEFLSIMLGVRRSSVSTLAASFQAAGLISMTRGNIVILDPEGLMRASCNCYRLIKGASDRILHN